MVEKYESDNKEYYYDVPLGVFRFFIICCPFSLAAWGLIIWGIVTLLRIYKEM